MQQKPVTILKDADGKAVGVIVETLDERFALELHTIDNGKEYTWPGAAKRLKELGKEGLNIKQGKLVAAYHEEINAALEEVGVDKLGLEWIPVIEYNGYNAWFYYPVIGALCYVNEYGRSQVRAVIDPELIEKLLHRAVASTSSAAGNVKGNLSTPREADLADKSKPRMAAGKDRRRSAADGGNIG